MTLLEELLAGAYKDRPANVRDDLRAIANDRLAEEPVRRARADLVLAGTCLNDILLAERQASRVNGQTASNGDQPPDGYLDKLRRAALTTEELKAIPKPPWILEDILQADSLAEIYGKPGSYKSFIAAAWAQHVSTGLSWSKRTVTPSPVVYIIAEGAHGMGERITAWETHHDATGVHPVIWLPLAVALGNPAWGTAVGTFAAEHEAGLVVFDTRARNTVGLEENSARDMGLVVANLDEARTICKACLLLVHHSNAFGDKSRGSTAIEGAVDTELSVKEADDVITLKLEKQKNAPDGTEWRFKAQPVAESIILEEVGGGPASTGITKSGHQIYEALIDITIDEGVSHTRWKASCDVADKTFNRQIKALVAAGYVTKEAGKYSHHGPVDWNDTNASKDGDVF